MVETRFYICRHCGSIIIKVKNSNVSVVCCEEKMELLISNEVEASLEKHIPVFSKEENRSFISIGSVLHPMGIDHHIAWIYIELLDGGILKYLPVDSCPSISVKEVDIIRVYAYCNLHGLWVCSC